jgi:hypothetical protein
LVCGGKPVVQGLLAGLWLSVAAATAVLAMFGPARRGATAGPGKPSAAGQVTTWMVGSDVLF